MKGLEEFKSRKEWEEYIWKEILEKLAGAKSKKEISAVLNRLLSNYEKRMMIRRFISMGLIRSGKTYREIGEILWVSPTTISAIKKNLLLANGYWSSRRYRKNKNKIAPSFL